MTQSPAAVEANDPSALLALREAIARLHRGLRPGQQQMSDWEGGPLAVSAVPGSGKSTGMATAAAILLAKRYLSQQGDEAALPPALANANPSSQLVLVTFTRSAVANLKAKVREQLRSLSLPPVGFVVYTLHGLALTIASRHPDLSGLDPERRSLVSPNQSNRLIRSSVEQWVGNNPQLFQPLLEGQQFDGEEAERLRRQSVLRTEVLPELAHTAIREAKSSGLLPEDLRSLHQRLEANAAPDRQDYNVLAIAAGLYENYQTLLHQRGFIDYDDMILAALRVLDNPGTRQYWQDQVFAVFEDEAQDSSPLQTQLLELLAGENRNILRVGDPNQAINSTFTPADPIFFRQFCVECKAQGRLAEMEQAGRSAPIIMDAANAMLTWVNQRYSRRVFKHPDRATPTVEKPFRTQAIHPVEVNDPQPNPIPEGTGLEIRYPPDVMQSVRLIAQRVAELVEHHPEGRMAVLVRENRQAQYIAELLRNPDQYNIEVDLTELGIDIYDVGQRDRQSHVPTELLSLLQFLDRPHSPDNLKAALRVLVDRRLIPPQDLNALSISPEQFLYPGPLDPAQTEPVQNARRYCANLLRARLELPPFQLLPFLAMTLRYDQSELATTEKLTGRVIQQTMREPSMAAVVEALGEIVRSESFDAVDLENPEDRYVRSRQLTLITMHKAKGLDWDFVFIPFLHDTMIPGSLRVLPQADFLGQFNLAEVARAQIRARSHGEDGIPDSAQAWEQAEYLKRAEEFRLLYVAMTRAKQLLWMSAARRGPFTWSRVESMDDRNPCPVLPVLSQQFQS